MKTVLFILGLIFSLPFVACSNDDDHYKPEEPVTRAFEQKYPGITPKEWERKGNYVVAEFYENGVEKEAWFDNTGNWYMTESDIRFSALPEAIKTAFAAGEYAQWHVDDVDMLERAGMETVYVIEVEQGKQEVDLYYTENGTLVKTVVGDDGSHVPSAGLPQAVTDYLNTHYAGARIVEYEIEKGILEVDIYHDNRYKEEKFDSQNQWLYTEWEVRQSDVPAVVLETIRTQYAAYRIDDIDFIESAADGSYYLFELEQGERDIYVRVNEDGTVLP